MNILNTAHNFSLAVKVFEWKHGIIDVFLMKIGVRNSDISDLIFLALAQEKHIYRLP